MRKIFIVIYYSLFVLSSSFAQSDSTYWNREFHFGTTLFLDRKDVAFSNQDGRFLPGYSASYALKKINENGRGIIFNCGMNTFNWKSKEYDYHENLGEDFIPVVRAVDYSHFKFTFTHIALGFYYRKQLPNYFFETDISPGLQLLNFSRYRNIRSFETGADKFLLDNHILDINIIPSVEFNARIGKRIGKRHLLFFNLKYIGFFDFKPFNYYSFVAFNLGLSKDFMLKKRKLKNGKKHRDNYIFGDAIGLSGIYSLNYERNISNYENFRFNVRMGVGYASNYVITAGMNLVLGHRYDRFETGFIYVREFENEEGIPTDLISPYLAYRWESPKNWLFRLYSGPAIKIADGANQYLFIFGGSVGKRFGRR